MALGLGSAWPPSSDSPNLHVVDGTSPGGVNMSSAQVDVEFIVIANEENETIAYRSGAMTSGCKSALRGNRSWR